jgi:hypothetical protein
MYLAITYIRKACNQEKLDSRKDDTLGLALDQAVRKFGLYFLDSHVHSTRSQCAHDLIGMAEK